MFENKEIQHTDLENLGEFGLIELLTKEVELHQPSTLKGVGDDGAVLKYGKDCVVVSTDLLVEGVHFDLGYTPIKHLGYKAVVVNVSDIYAMNAMPSQITVSLAVSNRFPLEALQELYAGIQLACTSYNVDLVGGDTTSSQKGLLISVTAVGHAPEKELTYRSGGKPDELLVVTGDLGSAYMGLQILRREQEVFKANPNHQPDLQPYTYLVERQLKPEARKDAYERFKELGIRPTSMIDISDGLSSEVLHLCTQGNLGCRIYEDKIPMDSQFIATCEEFGLEPITIALSGGEDYELLFSITQADYSKIKGRPEFTVIGHYSKAELGRQLITASGQQIALKARGWDGFGK